jgi:hypothetical protein
MRKEKSQELYESKAHLVYAELEWSFKKNEFIP